jgi:3-methyladenine DNA glycosylase AlkD
MDSLMDVQRIIKEIQSHMNGPVSSSLTNFGIDYKVNYGVSIPELQKIAEPHIGDHELALALFNEEIRECKIIATIIGDPQKITGEQIDSWADSFTNIEIVEQACSNLLWKSEYALSRSIQWCLTDDEFMQRAGLILVARNATDKEVKDIVFEPYINIIDSYDNEQIAQNKGPIEFALRQIGKRNNNYKDKILELAQTFSASDDEHRAWIGGQLLYEFSEEER